MAQPAPLDLLKQTAADLVALDLRSDSAVIARLFELILAAFHSGHSHRSIHAAIASGGVTTGWSNYRMALRRARKARGKAPPADQPPAHLAPAGAAVAAEPFAGVGLDSAIPNRSREMDTSTDGSAGTSTATHVMDALRQAREIASSKDYGQIGRDLYRQEQRNRQRKDRP